MSEWIDLFNGVDLTGWEDFKNPHLWSARDGMIGRRPAIRRR